MLPIVVALIILVHGLGHTLFLVPLLGISEWGQSTESWLVRDLAPSRLIGSILWTGAIVLFTLAAIQLFGVQGTWRPAAVLASVLSLGGIILYWDNSNNAASVFAATVDITLLLLVILAAGPSTRIIGI